MIRFMYTFTGVLAHAHAQGSDAGVGDEVPLKSSLFEMALIVAEDPAVV